MKATDEVEETPRCFLHYSERRILAHVPSSESPGSIAQQVFTSPLFGIHSPSLSVRPNSQARNIFSEGERRDELVRKIQAKIRSQGRLVFSLLKSASGRQRMDDPCVYCNDG